MKKENMRFMRIYLEELQPKTTYRKSALGGNQIRRVFEKVIFEVVLWTFLICFFHEIFIRINKYYFN